MGHFEGTTLMANKRDHNYEEPIASPSQPKKTSLKEMHEEAMKHVQNSGLKISSVEGPTKDYKIGSFTIKCKHGHEHVIAVDHGAVGAYAQKAVHVYGPGTEEDSDPEPAHTGTMKSALAFLGKKHGGNKTDEDDDDGPDLTPFDYKGQGIRR